MNQYLFSFKLNSSKEKRKVKAALRNEEDLFACGRYADSNFSEDTFKEVKEQRGGCEFTENVAGSRNDALKSARYHMQSWFGTFFVFWNDLMLI